MNKFTLINILVNDKFRKSLMTFLFTISCISMNGQSTYDWFDTAPDGNFKQGATGARWTGGLFDEPPYGIVQFNNNHQTTMFNNVPGPWSQFAINFGAFATVSRTINGNAIQFFDFSGTWPFIRNLSIATHTINFPIIVGSNNSFNLELITNAGNLNFGSAATLNNNGKTIFIYGNNSAIDATNRAVRLGGIVSGTGALNVSQFGTVKLNTIHSYTGQTQIDNGELWIESAGGIASSSTIFVGNGGQLANVAKIWISHPSGGTTVNNPITINNGNVTTRYLGGLNTSGTHLYSGNILNNNANSSLYLSALNAGGTTSFSGVISGAGSIITEGSGTIILSENNTYTGTTNVSAGTLVLNRVGGGTIPSSNNVVVNGGTLRISSNQSLSNLTLTSGELTVDPGITLTLNDVTISTGFVITNNGTINITGGLTDNRSTKTYNGTIQYSGASQNIVAGTYNNLSLLNSGTKTFGGDTTISGNFLITDASVVAPNTMTFNGAAAQNIAGLNYKNIAFAGAGSKTFTSNASVGATNGISFTGSGSVDFDGTSDNLNFILKSDNAGTASVGNATNWTLNGKVTTERFIPAKRAWRILATPLTGITDNTITDNWQGTDNEGILLFSPTATAENGYVQGGNAPNIKKYDAGWQNITDLTEELMFGALATDTKPFLVFPTGPSNSPNIAGGADDTTLRPKGQLITGTVSHNSLAANTYYALANPYASAIDPESLIANNVGQKLWLVNPSLGNFGGYVTFDGDNWSVPTNGNDAFIQSGQGFFVRSATENPFVINETDKVAGSSNNWFAKNATTSSTINADKIRVLLYKQLENIWKLADGTLTVNYAEGSNEVNAMDSNKISNFNESIMFRNNTTSLSIEHRALPIVTDIQPIRLTGTTVLPYQLRVKTENYTNSTLLPVLEDTTTGSFTAIPTDGSEVVIPFTGVASTSTNPDNRFRIVYQTNLSNVDQSPLLASVFPNPVTNNHLNIHLGSNSGMANYTITNLLGQAIQNGSLNTTQNVITLSAMNQGFYILNITQEGKSFTTKIYVQ